MAVTRRRMRRVQRFWRDESGQSSFFAALTLFLLVAAIGYSYNVGMVVSKRVRLQNAADAAALSAAAVEANALSAIAWLNGCETYIHARMQEILLDIPYTATAAATAEWGRYVQNRFGTGDLKKNPVEMYHNTNKAGFLKGLLNQIKDLLKKLGGIFASLGATGESPEDEKNLRSLLDEYDAKNTSANRKKEIEKTLLDKYGLDIRGRDNEENKRITEWADELIATRNLYEEKTNKYINRSKAIEGNIQNNNYDSCSQAKTHRDTMNRHGKEIRAGLASGAVELKDQYQILIANIDTDIKSLESKQQVLGEAIALGKKKNQSTATLEADLTRVNACHDALSDLKKKAKELDGIVQEMSALLQKINNLQNAIANEMSRGGGSIDPDTEFSTEKKEELIKKWREANASGTGIDHAGERAMTISLHNDPPEPWALLGMVPIAVINPYGPNMDFGRMTPLGTALSQVGIGGDYPEEEGIKRDANLEISIGAWAKEQTLAQGLPPWEELKTALAGPLGRYVWPDLMRIRYSLDSNVDSMSGFLDFFHNTLIKQAKRWVGYRDQSSGKGIRPGEQWIRQLSQISAAIASALPKLVRNEVVYSVAVNASVTTTVAIFPDPDDTEKWGDVAFARTDADAGQKFFRYDGWFTPPQEDQSVNRPWMPPPPYVNMYTLANSLAPSINKTVRYNNPAVWTDNGQLYANRFLNESRRQNLRMRTESVKEVGADKITLVVKKKLSSINDKVPGYIGKIINVQSLVHGISNRVAEVFPSLDMPFPSLSYVTLVDKADATDNGATKRYFRMNYEKSFYWDEYRGRVGGWPETDGPGAPVRIAVKCWNQNDRMWRQPKTDAKNNNKLLLGMFDGLANLLTMTPLTLPVPYASGHYSYGNGITHLASKSQINYNLSPRCQTGYAPGSNVFGLGHALFVPCHGDPNDAFGAADGHWHYMHYHAHSHSCQVGFPGVGLCSAMINCVVLGLADWLIKGGLAMGKADGPFDRRVGWDSTMHYPYKHWDGTVADDSSAMFVHDQPTVTDGEKTEYVEMAKNNHIFCAVSTSNTFSDSNYSIWNGISKFLNHGKGRRPPFTIPLTTDIKQNISQLVPPFSLYATVDNCPIIIIDLIVVKITICTHLLVHAKNFTSDRMYPKLHGHVTCDDEHTPILPKDMIPLFNTPVLWNWGDMDPSIISMWGAFLTRGDMEGDPLMALGSGDRFFYPEILYWLNGEIGKFLKTDYSMYATGRGRLFTNLNSPNVWVGEVVGTFGNAAKELANFGSLLNPIRDAGGQQTSYLPTLFGAVENAIGNTLSSKFGALGDTPAALANNAELYETGSVFHQVFTTIFDLLSRWGHHRFMTCPLCMSYCPVDCDFHKEESGYPIRHWGGDYGGADSFDILPGGGADFGGVVGTYYKALGFLSFMPGLLATGDQKADAGMSYANVLRGHDYSPAKTSKSDQHWYGQNSDDAKKDKIPHGNSYFDLGIDLDDSLHGNGPGIGGNLNKGVDSSADRDWKARFPTDRFVREWMSPVRKNSTTPDTDLAPTVVITENFMRHSITVAVVEEYRPMLWMFGGRRPMMAVATAKCGFIERPDAYVGDELVVVDGLGVGKAAAPQIITGIGEPDGGVDNNSATGWNLDSLWENFLDFPNARPIGESNLYYGNWGAKMIPTRFGILANAVRDTTNARRNTTNQLTDPEANHRLLWRRLGSSTCYRGDGVSPAGNRTLAARVGMSAGEWEAFVDAAIATARAVERGMTW